MKNILFSLILLCANDIMAQYVSGVTTPSATPVVKDDKVNQYANTITVEEMKQHLFTLASDEYGGRELGSEGIDLAAEYISNHFAQSNLPKTGLENSYYQKVSFTWLYWDNIFMKVNDTKYKHLWDFISFPQKNKDMSFTADEVIFLGYGIDDEKYSDYKKTDVKGKVVLIYEGEPKTKEGDYRLGDGMIPSEWSTDINKKIDAAAKHGVKELLIIADDIKGMIGENRNKLLGPKVILGDLPKDRAPVNYCHISSGLAKAILGDKVDKVIKARDCITKKGKSKSVTIPTKLQITQEQKHRYVEGRNVMAFIEGSDKKDEIVLLSAHYDHIGKKGKDINNGADDNASGTSTVLEIAEAFAEAKANGHGPRRSILCVLVTGEEKGLLGSDYYVENPTYPLEATIVDINIDMVGRLHEKYMDNPNYIYVIGSDRLSTDLHKINESVNDKYSKLTLDYTYNAADDPNRFYYRSDHYNFAKKGIPSIFFFNGTHEDYHRPTDTPDKIEFEKMVSVAKHIFCLAWELANRDERIAVDGEIGE